jgi:F0F1-type ATP synthase delta subunit
VSSAAPTELNATAIIANIKAAAYPHEVLMTIARGFLPLPQDDLIAVLAYLRQSPDAEIRAAAGEALNDVPPRALHAFASNENAPGAHLDLLLRAMDDSTVLEVLIRNRAVSDEAVVDLARRAEPIVQEVVVINQSRILRSPQILDALLENPNVSTEVRRRVLETREEFFEKKARLDEIKRILGEEETIDENASDEAIADLLEQAVADKTPSANTAGELTTAELEDQKKQSLWSVVLKMTVAEKVQLAFKGDKTIRGILIRDRNRLVSSATIKNPRVTENEVEAIAAMRNVEEEVLRIIGNRRDWTSKYPIARALANNPKAPVGVVLPLINRLTLRDLKQLKDDKGVSEAVRANARKMFQAKSKT